MKDFYIFGMGRSGTSIIQDYIANRLNNCCDVLDLGEIFSPYWYVSYADDRPIMIPDISAAESYSFTEHSKIFERYQGRHRLVKQIFWKQSMPAVEYSLKNKSATWIIISRNQTVDHFLSYAIAERTDTWNIRDNNEATEYRKSVTPFNVEQQCIDYWISLVKSFRAARSLVESSGIDIKYVSYERMAHDCDQIGQDLLNTINVTGCLWKPHTEDDFFANKTASSYKKLFSFEEKICLIKNWYDVENQIIRALGQ